MLAGGMLAFVMRERTLTLDSIFATIAAYLLLAGLFTQIYMCLLTWNPAQFLDARRRWPAGRCTCCIQT